MPPTPNLKTLYAVLVWRSRLFPTPNAISHYRKTCSSLATRFDITLQMNGFIAIANEKCVFVLEMA